VGGEIFRTCPDRPWGTPSLLYNGYRVFPGGKERPRRDADPSPPSSVAGYEIVELYLYSPCGPYGLHRASVPGQGCNLPFTFTSSLLFLCPAQSSKADARVHSKAIPREICGGQIGPGTGFLRVLWFSPVSIIQSMVHTHLTCILP